MVLFARRPTAGKPDGPLTGLRATLAAAGSLFLSQAAAQSAATCFSVQSSAIAPELNGVSLVSSTAFNSTQTFDAFLKTRSDNDTSYVDAFRTSYDCPAWDGSGQRYHLSYYATLLAYASQAPCAATARDSGAATPTAPKPLCKTTCNTALLSLQTIFNDPTKCVGDSSAAASRAAILQQYADYCAVLTDSADCLTGLASETAVCGFTTGLSAAKAFCASSTGSSETCCNAAGLKSASAASGSPSPTSNAKGFAKWMENGRNKTIFIVIMSILGALIVLAVLLLVMCCRRRAKEDKYNPRAADDGMMYGNTDPSYNAHGMNNGMAGMAAPIDGADDLGLYGAAGGAAEASRKHNQFYSGMTNATNPVVAPGGGREAGGTATTSAIMAGYYGGPPGADAHGHASMTPSAMGAAAAAGQTFWVTHAYAPRLSDELELRVGDEVAVATAYDDGWCSGYNLTRREEGTFPLACVSNLRQSTMMAGGSEAGDPRDSGALDTVGRRQSSLGSISEMR